MHVDITTSPTTNALRRPSRLLRRAASIGLSIALMSACGGSAGDDPELDHDHGSDGPHADEDCTTDLHAMDLHRAIHSTDADGAAVWIVEGRSGETFLTWTIRENEDGTLPTEGDFGVEQLTPAEASSALLVQTECHEHGDHFHCGPSFVATGGSFRITAIERNVGGAFAATLSAHLEEARIARGKATLVEDGHAVCLHDVALEGPLAAP